MRLSEREKNGVLQFSVAEVSTSKNVGPFKNEVRRLEIQHGLRPTTESVQHLTKLEFVAAVQHCLVRLLNRRNTDAVNRSE